MLSLEMKSLYTYNVSMFSKNYHANLKIVQHIEKTQIEAFCGRIRSYKYNRGIMEDSRTLKMRNCL